MSPMTTDYTNVKLGDVTGWAPTPDTFEFNFNYCDGGKQFVPPANGTIKPSGGDGNVAAIRGLRDGDYDALYIYADQIYNFINSGDDIANGFGTDFAYIHTGLDQWSINGTTLAISKRGSGLKQVLDPCIAAVQRPTPHSPRPTHPTPRPHPLPCCTPHLSHPSSFELMRTKCLPLSASACPPLAPAHTFAISLLSLSPARARQHTRRPPSPPASARQDADLPGYLHQALPCILVHQQPGRGSRADLLRCQDERTHRRENLRRRLLHVLGLEQVGRPRR